MGPPNNQQRLREIGMLTDDELPEAYAAAVNALTPAELDALASIKQRLDLVQETSGIEMSRHFVAP